MAPEPSCPEKFTESFFKAAQYIVRLTSGQDILEEFGRILVNYFQAEWCAFARRTADGEVLFQKQGGGSEVIPAQLLTQKTRGLIQDVLETGFLATETFPGSEPFTVLFLPLSESNQTTAVLIIAHKASTPISPELLNLYLALIGIMGTTLDRITQERKLRTYQNQLEDLVEERTLELTATNKQLEQEIAIRLEAEAALRENEQRWATTLASIGDAVIATDVEGRITFMNAVAEELTGWTLGEAIQKRVEAVLNIINEKTRQPVDNPVGKVLQEGTVVGLANGTLLVRKDGQEVPIDDSGAPIKDWEGKMTGVVLVFRDITERRLGEEAQRQTEAQRQVAEAIEVERRRLLDVLETLPAMISLLTPDYQVIFANRSFRNRFGELDGRHCYEYAFGFNEPCVFCESFQVLTTGRPHHWEVLSPEGSTIDAYDFPFTDVDGSRLILEMHTDITARKQAEEELRQAHNKIKFFAAQSLTAQEMERKRIAGELHDGIASSLMAVKIRIDQLVEELKPGAGDPAALQDLGLKVLGINNEVRRLMVDLRPAILDDLGIVAALNWFCREYQKTYPAFAVENRISVLEDEVPDSIKTPIFRISQEAMNNIAKYSCASLVKMFLRKEGAKIRLTIADNGRGFDPETIRRGLGLSTMRERAELSGGSFDLEAETGKGTTIRAEWAE